jgi:hypothetical protein
MCAATDYVCILFPGAKAFGGLYRDYYHARWEAFVQAMYASLDLNMPFDQSKYDDTIDALGQQFIHAKDKVTYTVLTYTVLTAVFHSLHLNPTASTQRSHAVRQ